MRDVRFRRTELVRFGRHNLFLVSVADGQRVVTRRRPGSSTQGDLDWVVSGELGPEEQRIGGRRTPHGHCVFGNDGASWKYPLVDFCFV